MLAERLLTAGRSREISLRQLAMKYAGIAMDKTIRKSFVGVKGDDYLSEAQLTYAARDALDHVRHLSPAARRAEEAAHAAGRRVGVSVRGRPWATWNWRA